MNRWEIILSYNIMIIGLIVIVLKCNKSFQRLSQELFFKFFRLNTVKNLVKLTSHFQLILFCQFFSSQTFFLASLTVCLYSCLAGLSVEEEVQLVWRVQQAFLYCERVNPVVHLSANKHNHHEHLLNSTN